VRVRAWIRAGAGPGLPAGAALRVRAGARRVVGTGLLVVVTGAPLAACGAEPVPGPTVTVAPAPARTHPPAPAPPSPSPSPTPTEPAGTISAISPELAARMAPSWREGCPVPLADLRYLTVPYIDMAGQEQRGALVVHADVADAVLRVFASLREAGYPVRSMRLVDDFGADDGASMAADNTSAFNCRLRTGGTEWSEHAYGRAIDLNPVENPYVVGSHVAPREGVAYLDRPVAPGVLHADDAAVRAFAAEGWTWGGTWTGGVLDYQHFSATGR
jgi:poly-gamma-glutamate synthesis protein (capsule biosynthesis protein)